MIQRTIQTVEAREPAADWKTLLKESRISTAKLLQALKLDGHPLADAGAEQLFELRVPAPYLAKIEAGNPNDPLLLQVLPQAREQLQIDGYSSDPLNEETFSPLPGLIHKYKSRVLFIATQSCAIHCRYCFRRSFPYNEHRVARNDWQNAIDYIGKHPEVNEVILSGGDPLLLTNEHLAALLKQIVTIKHITRVRLHSRLLNSLPQRIDDGLVALLSSLNTKIVFVMHCNHPNEIGDDVADAALRLKKAGATLLNQSVLLQGVNDHPETLAKLSESLFSIGVLPYYLFTLDKVNGAAHFDLPLIKAQEIYQELQGLVPGYLLPRLVSEIPDQSSKTLVHCAD